MFNFRDTAEQQIYVSSDFHLNHNPKWGNPIWKMRGFTSATEMTDGIIKSINDTVRANDILIFLGDFCLNTTLLQFEDLLSRIACQNVYMMMGNHPNPHYKNVYLPMVKQILGESYTSESEVYPLRYKNAVYIGPETEMVLNGQYVVLSHYPIYVWNNMAHGAWMLCGHSHNGCPLSRGDTTHGKILDVGWDGHGKPWSMTEIQEVMNKKQILVVDHHRPDGPKEPLTV